MAKPKSANTPLPDQYLVVAGIENDNIPDSRHEPGEVVTLDPKMWDVEGYLACGAIIPYLGEVNNGGEDKS